MNSILTITSPQNASIKNAIKLRDRRGRRQQNRTIIDGLREVCLAVESDWKICELYCRESIWNQSESVREICDQAVAKKAMVRTDVDSVFDKLTFGDRDEGVVAIAEPPTIGLDALTIPERGLVCVLDQVEKPGNFGAILRTADAAGVDAVVLSNPMTDIFNPNAIRASLGAIFHVPLGQGTADDVIAWLLERQCKTLAARVDGQSAYDAMSFQERLAIVLGRKANGLGDEWRRAEVQSISIPMQGRVDSLNVSTSAAVLLFEAVRQRGGAS